MSRKVWLERLLSALIKVPDSEHNLAGITLPPINFPSEHNSAVKFAAGKIKNYEICGLTKRIYPRAITNTPMLC